MLIENHKRERVVSAREFPRRYAGEKDNFLDSIITGNETRTYHFTPEMKQQSRQWQQSSSPNLRKLKQAQSAGKVMTTVFCDRKGVLWVDFMVTGTTINADRYTETLKKLRLAIQNRRRGMLSKGVSILHDKAQPNAARQTVTLLQRFGWDIITHPPYMRTWHPVTSTSFRS